MKPATITLLRLGAPLLALTSLSTLTGGIWLGFLGEWQLVLIGLVAMGVSALPLSLACLPAALLGLPAMGFAQKGRTVLAATFGIGALLYTSMVVGAWGATALWFFSKASGAGSDFPFLLWGLGVSISPWAVMARSELDSGGNEFSLVSIFFLQIAYIGGSLAIVTGYGFIVGAMVIAVIMVGNAVVQAFLVENEEVPGAGY
jgi:hypothetical protein